MTDPGTPRHGDAGHKRIIVFGLSAVIVAGVIGGVGGYLYLHLNPGPPGAPKQPSGASQIAASAPPPPKSSTPRMAPLTPMSGIVVGKQSGTATTSLVAENGPLAIIGISIAPSTPDVTLDTSSPLACKRGMRLELGDSCTIVVTWTPATPGVLSRQLAVRTNGTPPTLVQEIRGDAVVPKQPAPASLPPPPPAYQSIYPEDNIAALDSRAGPIAPLGSTIKPQPAAFEPPADWSSVGDGRKPSSPPVDMTLVIPKDSYIPAVIETTIDTAQAGRAVAVVERNVFGAQGRKILIPAGSRVFGSYSTTGRAILERVRVTWSRITTPDGVRYDLANAAGADAMGQVGLVGPTDQRFFAKYATSLLTTAINTAAILSLGGTSTSVSTGFGSTTTNDASQAAQQQLTQDISDLGRTIIKDNFDFPPIHTIPAGTRITILPATDIWLRLPGEPIVANNGNGPSNGTAGSARTALTGTAAPSSASGSPGASGPSGNTPAATIPGNQPGPYGNPATGFKSPSPLPANPYQPYYPHQASPQGTAGAPNSASSSDRTSEFLTQ